VSIAVERPTLTINRSIRVVLALARREGSLLVRHPIFIVGFLMSLGLFGLFTWHNAPVLHRDDTHVAGALLPLAAATLMAANLAAIRGARDGTDELFEGLPTEAIAQTAGHLLSLLWAVAASILSIAVMFGYLFLDDPVGAPRVSELLAAPIGVVICGAIGIALGRWRSHVAIAPMAVVVVGALQILLIQPVVGLHPAAPRAAWFAPWVPMSLTSGVPPELVIRPAGWHALYLAGIAGVVMVVALMRHGRRPRLLALGVTALCFVAVGGVGQTRPPSQAQLAAIVDLLERPEEHQVCRGVSGNTYCAYPAYEGWIERWSGAIGGVLEQLPPEARPEGLVIRQSFGAYFEGHVDVPQKVSRRAARGSASADIEVGPEWGRDSSVAQFEFGLIMPVVARALELPIERGDIRLTPADVELLSEHLEPQLNAKRFKKLLRTKLKVGGRWEGCRLNGQARAAVGMWLAAQATPATRHAFLRATKETPFGLTFDHERREFYYLGPFAPLYWSQFGSNLYLVGWPDAEFHYAARLLSRSDEAVGEEIRSRWDVFTAPTTPTDTFVTAFDLERLPTIEEQAADAPDGYSYSEDYQQQSPEDFIGGVPPCH
jgi:hypothetical protein